MKIAVITPYYQEEDHILLRCRRSVYNQTHFGVNHMFVADGLPRKDLSFLGNIEHLILPNRHADAGATPRAIGAISAFSRGYDAVAFLDADNTFMPNHLETMAGLLDHPNQVIAATRNICTRDGEIMYTDRVESNGSDFCDTNCLFLGKGAVHLLTYWVTDTASRLWSDRHFWSAIKQSGIGIKHTLKATVNYHSRWAWHYQQAGRTPPPDSVWISTDDSGNLIHKQHSN